MAAQKKQPAKSPAPAAKSSAKKAGSSAVKSANAKVSPVKVTKTPPANNKSKAASASKGTKAKAVASSSKKTATPSSPNKYETLIDFNNMSERKPAAGPSTTPSTPRRFLFGSKDCPSNDGEMKTDKAGEESDSDQYHSDEYEDEIDIPITELPLAPGEEAVAPDHPSVPRSLSNKSRYKMRSSHPKHEHDPNGRYHGRRLVPWHRPRMMEKLLVFLKYECEKTGVQLPWDEVVQRMQPGSSGPSAMQYLEKMRTKLIIEGHIVPPEILRHGIPVDPNVRALVRADPNGDPGKVRIVKWDEQTVHPKKSLENPGIINGSGSYRRGPDGRRSTGGAARDQPRLKVEYPEDYVQKQNEIAKALSVQRTKDRRQRAKDKKRKPTAQLQPDEEERGEVADPADLESDKDFDPRATKKPRRSTRKSRAKVGRRMDEVEEAETAPAMMQFGSTDEVTSKEASTLPIKLSMSPEKLAKFPAGQSFSLARENQNDDPVDHDEPMSDVEQHQEAESSQGEDEECDECDEMDGEVVDEDQMEEEEHFEEQYLGYGEHGTLAQFYDQRTNNQSNGYGSPILRLRPNPSDDVFDGPDVSPPYGMGQHVRYDPYDFNGTASNSHPASGHVSTANPFESSQETFNAHFDGYDMNGSFGHENLAPTPQYTPGMTFDQAEGDFRVYEEEPSHLENMQFEDYGAITPQHRPLDFFDDQDENIPPGDPLSPIFHGYDDHPGFGGSLFQQ